MGFFTYFDMLDKIYTNEISHVLRTYLWYSGCTKMIRNYTECYSFFFNDA